VILISLANKDNGVATEWSSQKGRSHSENSDAYLNARSVQTTAQFPPTESFISASSDMPKKLNKPTRFSRSRRLELALQHERSRIPYANDSCYLADAKPIDMRRESRISDDFLTEENVSRLRKEKRIDLSLQSLSEESYYLSSICPPGAEGDSLFDLGVMDRLMSQLKSPEAGFPSRV
jgi:hypothetical protein